MHKCTWCALHVFLRCLAPTRGRWRGPDNIIANTLCRACVARHSLNFQRPSQSIHSFMMRRRRNAPLKYLKERVCAPVSTLHQRPTMRKLKRARKTKTFYFLNNNLEFTGWMARLVRHQTMLAERHRTWQLLACPGATYFCVLRNPLLESSRAEKRKQHFVAKNEIA